MKTRSLNVLITLTVCLMLAGACGKPGVSTITEKSVDATAKLDMQRETTVAKFDTPAHVVILIEENHAYSQIIGASTAPYINSLATDTDAVSFTDSHAIEHPSQPNYLDLFSGSDQGITSDNLPSTFPFTTPNLGAQLIAAKKTFTIYSEGLPSVGYNGASSGEYARKHNPASNWMGTGTNNIPTTTNQPFTAFPTNYANLPTVSIVVPNLDDDMHDGTIKQGDTWAKTNIKAYVTWAKKNKSILILTWDEDDNEHGNLISTIIIGQQVKYGNNDPQAINHYSVLRTIEDMYKLPYAGAASTATDITGIWR